MRTGHQHLADLGCAKGYAVRVEFTDRLEPSTISCDGLPIVSLETEIVVNSPSSEGRALREQYGRIPYGAPLYTWELQQGGRSTLLYVGQTTLQRVQDRFGRHATVVKLLAKYVNDPTAFVYFRLCSRLDLQYEHQGVSIRRAVEQLPITQARKIVDDIEAYLIYSCKPTLNTNHREQEKRYWKPFSIDRAVNIRIPKVER